MQEATKFCSKCHAEKPVGRFFVHTKEKGYLHSWCKVCDKKFMKGWRNKNLKRMKDSAKIWRQKNIVAILAKAKQWRLDHPDWRKTHLERYRGVWKRWYRKNGDKVRARVKQWGIDNPLRKKEMRKRYRLENPEKCREVERQWHWKNAKKCRRYRADWIKRHPEQAEKLAKLSGIKKRSTIRGRLDGRMSSGIGIALRGSKNGQHWEDLVGYTLDDLKKRLESKFVDGMSWENMSRWHVDHVAPKVRFHYKNANDPEFRICWGLENLQPLWAQDNRLKHTKTMAEWRGQ